MTEKKKGMMDFFTEILPKIEETRKEVLAAYGEGLDAGLNIGMKPAMSGSGKEDESKRPA